MIEARRDLDLAQEALRTERCGHLGAQHFHRHLAVMLEIQGFVHGGHAALPKWPVESVAVGEGRGEVVG
jgi:hypothetical protein